MPVENTPGSSLRPALVEFLALVILVYCLPVALILLNVVAFSGSHLIATGGGMALAALLVVIRHRRSLHDLGFRRETLPRALLLHGAAALLLLAALTGLFWLGLLHKPTPHPWSATYLYYILVSSPVQEFLFRSALFAEMIRAGILKRGPQVAITAAAYGAFHLIFLDPIIVVVSLLMGVVWGLIYSKAPNFWAVTIAHAGLGSAALAAGLIY